MAHEHVGEPGCEPAPGDEAHARGLRLFVEGDQTPQRVVAVRARRERDSRPQRRAGDSHIGLAGHGGRHRVDAIRHALARREPQGFGTVVQGGRDLARVPEVTRAHEDPVDARGVEQLTRGAHADLTQADDEDGAHETAPARVLRGELTGTRVRAARASHRC